MWSACVLVLACACAGRARNYQLGESVGSRLVYYEDIHLVAVRDKSRVKVFFYYTDDEELRIEGISAIDWDLTEARVSVVAGGVGFTFIGLRIAGERGKPVNYEVQVFASCFNNYADDSLEVADGTSYEDEQWQALLADDPPPDDPPPDDPPPDDPPPDADR